MVAGLVGACPELLEDEEDTAGAQTQLAVPL